MFFKRLFIFFALVILSFFPDTSFAGVLSNANKNSICDITMAHDAIIPSVIQGEIKTIGGGDIISHDVTLINRTSYAYKNTKILVKVFYYDEKSYKTEDKRLNAGRLVDFYVDDSSYTVAPGERKNIKIAWKSPVDSINGKYRIDLYVIQNETHVIGDFARPYTSYASFEFNVIGSDDNYPISVDMDNAKISNVKYLLDSKLITLLPENKDEFLTIPLTNTSTSSIKIKYKWRVGPYGKFDESKIFYREIKEIELKPREEIKIILNTPKDLSNRYYGVLDIENGEKHLLEVFRWTRSLPVPALVDTYGIVPDGNYLIDNKDSETFTLEKGKKYVAFACLIGGLIPTDTILTMRLRDEKGKVIFSQEQKKITATTTTAFEYTFIPTRNANKYSFDITSDTNGMVEKVRWENDCSKSSSTKCIKDRILDYGIYEYLLSILIIIFLFSVMHYSKK